LPHADGQGLEGRAEVNDLLLESMNPYVAAILGYKATAVGCR